MKEHRKREILRDQIKRKYEKSWDTYHTSRNFDSKKYIDPKSNEYCISVKKPSLANQSQPSQVSVSLSNKKERPFAGGGGFITINNQKSPRE